MKNKHLKLLQYGLRTCFFCGGVVFLPMLPIGCSGHGEILQGRMGELEERIRELERHNGRVGVKVDDLEDQFALLTDRVETNRMAMERRGHARSLPLLKVYPDGSAVPSVPTLNPLTPGQPDPYGSGPHRLSRGPEPSMSDVRVNKRIPVPSPGTPRDLIEDEWVPGVDVLDPQDDRDSKEDHVVISEDDYRAFVQEYGIDSPPEPRSRQRVRRAAGVSRPRQAKTPVTDETLSVLPIESSLRDATSARSKMDIYKSGLSKYRAGNYSAAMREFKFYLEMGPNSDYLDNAYYWLGECSFGLGQYEAAIGYFDRVLNETPGGNKVPDSMLKASLAYLRIGRSSEAKSILYNLIETYPKTNAAKLATQKLNKID